MYFTNLLRMPSFATDSSPGSKNAILEGFRRTKCQSHPYSKNVRHNIAVRFYYWLKLLILSMTIQKLQNLFL